MMVVGNGAAGMSVGGVVTVADDDEDDEDDDDDEERREGIDEEGRGRARFNSVVIRCR